MPNEGGRSWWSAGNAVKIKDIAETYIDNNLNVDCEEGKYKSTHLLLKFEPGWNLKNFVDECGW